MLDAVDKAHKTYNEGRLAFRQYFATCGIHVKSLPGRKAAMGS